MTCYHHAYRLLSQSNHSIHLLNLFHTSYNVSFVLHLIIPVDSTAIVGFRDYDKESNRYKTVPAAPASTTTTTTTTAAASPTLPSF